METLKERKEFDTSADYLRHCKSLGQNLVRHKRAIVSGQVYQLKINLINMPCSKCPSHSLCGPKLCMVCMFADEAYDNYCKKEGGFYHPVYLEPIK